MARLELSIRQGATFLKTFRWREANGTTPIPLTGLQARMVFAPRLNTAVPTITLTSSPAAGLTLDVAGGNIVARISAVITASLSPGTLLYELELYDPLDLTEVPLAVQGSATVRAQVSP